MKVLEAIQRSTEFLAKKGVDSPRLQTELLLAHLLKLERMQLYLNFEQSLAEPEVTQLRELIRRRAAREPLQHILGSTSFCGFDIAVNRHVLIPRPETELLAERGWTFLNQNKIAGPAPAVLDFGTGSGCLAIALAAKSPASGVIAVDISAEALALARENATRHNLSHRIRFILSDGFASLSSDLRFDLIISNPPYIPTAELAALAPEVRDHDPRAALDGGADGLDFYRRLAAEAPAFLQSEGRLLLEIGDGQAQALRDLLQRQMWVVEAVERDYSHRERILIAHR